MKSWEEIIDVLKKNLVSLGDVTITPAILITAVLIILGAFWVSRLLRGMLRRSLFRRTHLNIGTQETICRILHYIIMSMGFFIAIQQVGGGSDNLDCDKCGIDGRDRFGVTKYYQ